MFGVVHIDMRRDEQTLVGVPWEFGLPINPARGGLNEMRDLAERMTRSASFPFHAYAVVPLPTNDRWF